MVKGRVRLVPAKRMKNLTQVAAWVAFGRAVARVW